MSYTAVVRGHHRVSSSGGATSTVELNPLPLVATPVQLNSGFLVPYGKFRKLPQEEQRAEGAFLVHRCNWAQQHLQQQRRDFAIYLFLACITAVYKAYRQDKTISLHAARLLLYVLLLPVPAPGLLFYVL